MRVRQDTRTLPSESLEQCVALLSRRYDDIDGTELIRAFVEREYPGRIALASSFGAESAVLLHMISVVDPTLPVLFLDTGKLFDETLAYRDTLVRALGLSGVRAVTPWGEELAAVDPDGTLHQRDPDLCCFVRKVAPLDRILGDFSVWITGRKAYHGGDRSALPAIEAAAGRIKLNPIVGWDPAAVEAYLVRHDLPRHPLQAEGYPSIGCAPCTVRVCAGEDPRAGRWQGMTKRECGIHQSPSAGAVGGDGGGA